MAYFVYFQWCYSAYITPLVVSETESTRGLSSRTIYLSLVSYEIEEENCGSLYTVLR